MKKGYFNNVTLIFLWKIKFKNFKFDALKNFDAFQKFQFNNFRSTLFLKSPTASLSSNVAF